MQKQTRYETKLQNRQDIKLEMYPNRVAQIVPKQQT